MCADSHSLVWSTYMNKFSPYGKACLYIVITWIISQMDRIRINPLTNMSLAKHELYICENHFRQAYLKEAALSASRAGSGKRQQERRGGVPGARPGAKAHIWNGSALVPHGRRDKGVTDANGASSRNNGRCNATVDGIGDHDSQ